MIELLIGIALGLNLSSILIWLRLLINIKKK